MLKNRTRLPAIRAILLQSGQRASAWNQAFRVWTLAFAPLPVNNQRCNLMVECSHH
jgi:hypothetical protein